MCCFALIAPQVFIEPVTITEEGCNKEIRKLETGESIPWLGLQYSGTFQHSAEETANGAVL